MITMLSLTVNPRAGATVCFAVRAADAHIESVYYGGPGACVGAALERDGPVRVPDSEGAL